MVVRATVVVFTVNALGLSTGCLPTPGPFEPGTVDTADRSSPDADGDGFTLDAGDCDDGDPEVYPGAAEVCDGLDNDCDGLVDDEDDVVEGTTTIWYEDGDGDGFGTSDVTTEACDVPSGYVDNDRDCDDADTNLGDVDNDLDCDGWSTETDCDDDDASQNYDDMDADGYSTCDDDCNDSDDLINPGAEDGLLTDHDCDGEFTSHDLSLSDYTFLGEDSGQYLGRSVAAAGDVDGDGLADLLIGSHRNDENGENTGKVYLIMGASLGESPVIDLSLADYVFLGETALDYAGWAVSSAGDVDGDGLDDILIGAYNNEEAATGAGKAYVILAASLGSTEEIDLVDADIHLLGESTSNRAGYSVSDAGDVDNDGLDDFLVGSKDNGDGGTSAGKVYLLLGKSFIDLGEPIPGALVDADYVFLGDLSFDAAGTSLANAGDVDGDGFSDFLIGAPRESYADTRPGRVYLLLGGNLGDEHELELSEADYILKGESGEDHTGCSVSGAGDVDGDGLDDIVIGSEYGGDAGTVYVVLASSLGSEQTIDLANADYHLAGVAADDRVGAAVGGAGDIDGDGLDDILVGAPAYDGQGMVYLVLNGDLSKTNRVDLDSVNFRFFGEQSEDNAGIGVAVAGDVNGDGLDDI